jgi:hypothetical protein
VAVPVPTPPGGPDRQPPAPPAAHPRWRVAALVIGAAAIAVIAFVLVAARTPAASADTAAVSVHADSIRTVVVQDVPGQLTVTGVPGSQVTMTGQLHWTGRSAAVSVQPRPAGHLLRLVYRCAAGSPCTANLRLTVPPGTAIVLHQPSGHVVLAGLAGALRITARNADVQAAGLRSPAFVAAVTSGHLSATFDSPPGRVAVTLASAQATLRLPANVSYRLSQQVTSGYLRAGIPQASDATRSISARVDSGELELLPR